MTKLVLLKFINGDEVLGRVESEDVNGWELSKPMTLNIQQGPQGLSANFIPTMLMTGNSVWVPVGSVMMVGTPDSDYEKRYLEVTSGISLATSL